MHVDVLPSRMRSPSGAGGTSVDRRDPTSVRLLPRPYPDRVASVPRRAGRLRPGGPRTVLPRLGRGGPALAPEHRAAVLGAGRPGAAGRARRGLAGAPAPRVVRRPP